MPLPIIGAASLVGKLFGGVVKNIRSARLKKKAKKQQEKAEILAAQAVNKLQGLSGALFSVNQPVTTDAQKTVFPEKEPMVSFASNQVPAVEPWYKKIPVLGWVVGGLVLLFVLFKMK